MTSEADLILGPKKHVERRMAMSDAVFAFGEVIGVICVGLLVSRLIDFSMANFLVIYILIQVVLLKWKLT